MPSVQKNMIKYLEYLNVNIECSLCSKRDHAMLEVNHDWEGLHTLQIADHFNKEGWWVVYDTPIRCPKCEDNPRQG